MSITLKPAPSRSSVPAHFRGIDGLRALAILGVIAFHTRPSLLQGGFIGVTMFFVITGFLATRSKWVRSMAILVIMAASTADMVLLFDPANTSRVYYGTDTRLAELAAGALLAIWIAPSSRGTEAAEAGAASQTVQIERQAGDKTGARLTIVCNVLGTAALAALLTGFWFANGYLSYMYQGGYLITAFISLCALACAVNNDSI